MLGLFGSFAALAKVRTSHADVDDATFRLHYRWTSSICFLGCLLVATSDLVGSPIHCLMDGQEAPKPITTYCWVSSVFTLIPKPGSIVTSPLSNHDHFHGIGTYDPTKHETRRHFYYQWVPFILFILGCYFYLPHFLWKEIEGKKCDNLLQGLNVLSFDADRQTKKQNIVRYLHLSRGKLNNRYAYLYFLMQILNLFVVFTSMLILERFFGGIYMNYGSEYIRYLNEDEDVGSINPLNLAFPRIGKCTFRMFGPSGTPETRDAMCLLTQNIMNEKIFLFLWFWLIFLMILNSLNILFLLMQFVSEPLRAKILEQYSTMISSHALVRFLQTTDLGDYFLLLDLGKNLDPLTFKEIIEELIYKCEVPQPAMADTPLAIHEENPTYHTFDSVDGDLAMAEMTRRVDDDDLEPEEMKRRMAADDFSHEGNKHLGFYDNYDKID